MGVGVGVAANFDLHVGLGDECLGDAIEYLRRFGKQRRGAALEVHALEDEGLIRAGNERRRNRDRNSGLAGGSFAIPYGQRRGELSFRRILVLWTLICTCLLYTSPSPRDS